MELIENELPQIIKLLTELHLADIIFTSDTFYNERDLNV